MAKPENQSEQLLSIDRRQLLGGTAVMATATIVPNVATIAKPAPLMLVVAPTAPPQSELPLANACAATRARILEIARRNAIRREAGLPLLSVTRELRRLVTEQGTQRQRNEREQFRQFEAVHGEAAFEEATRPWRARGIKPNSIIGMGIQAEMNRILRKRFDDERKCPGAACRRMGV